MSSRAVSLDAVTVGASAAVASAGVLAVSAGSAAAWVVIAVSAAAAATIYRMRRSTAPPSAPEVESIAVSDWGVTRLTDETVTDSVAWTDLEEVMIVTTADGPNHENLYLVLRGTSGASIIAPHPLVVESGILTELEERLQGYDTDTFFEAMMNTGDEVFVVWRAARAAIHTPVVLDWKVRVHADRKPL